MVNAPPPDHGPKTPPSWPSTGAATVYFRPIFTVWYDWAALLALIFLVVAGCLWVFRTNDRFIVAAYRTRQIDDVKAELSRSGIRFSADGEYSDKPEGEVTRQHPEAGASFHGDEARIARDRGVRLIYSKGKKVITLPPDLLKKSNDKETIIKRLKPYNLRLVIEERPTPEAQAGTVLDINPKPGKDVKAGSATYKGDLVTLFVSSGIPSGQVVVKARGEVSGGTQWLLRYKPELGENHNIRIELYSSLNEGSDGNPVPKVFGHRVKGGTELRIPFVLSGYSLLVLYDNGVRITDWEVAENGLSKGVGKKTPPVNPGGVGWYSQ